MTYGLFLIAIYGVADDPTSLVATDLFWGWEANAATHAVGLMGQHSQALVTLL